MSEGLKYKRGDGRRVKRLERARLHNLKKAKRYTYYQSVCYMCGGEMTWCGCCDMWSSNCCISYGTCMCS